MTIENLTPHVVVVVLADGSSRRFEPSGGAARCRTIPTPAGEVDGVPLSRVEFGPVEGLPAPREGTVLIVSALVRAAVPERTDVTSPGDLVRDAAGNVIGCRGLIING